MNKGISYAIVAYGIWGLFPLYWKPLQAVPALQVLGHRIIWSFVLLAAILTVTRQWTAFRAAAFQQRTLRIYAAAALLISLNWGVYVWAVISGFVVESSLGYFINPLVSVLLGVIFLGERLRPGQWMAVGLAALGVLIVALAYGSFPVIALTLACSFGLYGLVKKTAPLNALHGLTLETGLLFAPTLIYLLTLDQLGQGVFLHTDAVTSLLLVGAGMVTTIPLLMFSAAARNVPLVMMGLLQYITPTMLFFLGVFVYHEAFSLTRLIGFVLVWAALVVFSVEGFLARAARREVPAVAD
jgi:chloramphenicol-sensitive protein RarD